MFQCSCTIQEESKLQTVFDDRNFCWTVCGVYYRLDDCTFRERNDGMMTIEEKNITKCTVYQRGSIYYWNICIYVASLVVLPTSNIASVFAIGETQQVWQPDIKASDMYQYYTMILGKDIKNLVIVIV